MPAPPAPPTQLPVLLRGVSRSFHVSIRLLPAALRRPVSVAYLLARAADTLADAAGLPDGERRRQLETLAAAVDGRLPLRVAAAGLTATPERCCGTAAERDLMAALPSCLALLDELEPADHDDIRAVLRQITQGQLLDVERFAQGVPGALDTAQQLDHYTYLVAGCVGEFWTDLCFRHLPGFAALPQPQMRELGREFGMGLQLVNILRDAGADLAGGRCYFPAEELAAAGLQPQEILGQPDRFEGVWNSWQARASRRLDCGMQYADAVRNRRVRAAGAIPALLGARTLALLRSTGPQRLRHAVKMPRHEVRSILLRLALTLAARAPLHAQFDRLRGPSGIG